VAEASPISPMCRLEIASLCYSIRVVETLSKKLSVPMRNISTSNRNTKQQSSKKILLTATTSSGTNTPIVGMVGASRVI